MYKVMAVSLLLSACALTPQQNPAPMPPANDPVTLRLNLFRGASNIPIYMAIEKGFFARRGITPTLEFTPNSDQQRAGLAAGKFDIAVAAVDNAVAMVEVAKADVVIVAGGDGGMNELVVRPDVRQLSDVRGRNLVVDAPNTAYALLARKILKNAGLVTGKDYQLDPQGGTEARSKSLASPASAATLLNPPWSFIAKQRGAMGLGSTTELYGAYQASGVFVMRPWAAGHASALERFLGAYIEGCRAVLDPAQHAVTVQLLARELKLEPHIAELTYQQLTTGDGGIAADCAFSMQGFRNVLALRAEIEGQWNGTPPAPEKYLDLGYYDRALRYAASPAR